MVITTVLYNGDHPVIKRGWNMAYLVIRSMISQRMFQLARFDDTGVYMGIHMGLSENRVYSQL